MNSIMINILKFIFKNKVRVLFYHRINNDGDSFGIAEDEFDRQMQYLSRGYNIISLSEYINHFENNKYIKNKLLITFDDGYKDNFTYAYPILKKYSVPATIFLTTDFIDNKMWLWHDLYRYLVDSTTKKSICVQLGGHALVLNFESMESKINSRKIIHRYLKNLSYQERMKHIFEMAEFLEVALPEHPTNKYSPLSWDEIREMSEDNIEFGAHTCSHKILSQLSSDEVFHEALYSKKRIEDELGRTINTFAYPNGQLMDFTEETINILQKCGYRAAFTTIVGINEDIIDNLAIKRIYPGPIFDNQFAFKVAGLDFIKTKVRQFFFRSSINATDRA
jgi:peptidoglycan/xylan/chitin deacetylase (PgdA/CDA1 family)